MKSKKLRTEKRRWRRRFISIATASASAITILSTMSLPQHAVVVAASEAVDHQEEERILSDHRQRKLTEQRRRLEEQRRRLEEQWTAEAIQNLQTLDYVLDESDTSNNPRYFIRSRDGMLRPPNAIHVDEDISSLEEEGESDLGGDGGTSNTEVVHHQKSKLGPTNKGNLHMMNQFQHWQSGDRNLRGGDVDDSLPEELDQIMTFLYDEDDPEEDLDGYDLVYIGNEYDATIQQQQSRELSLANDFVGNSSSSANSFVDGMENDPKGKGKSPPQGKDKDQLLPFGKKANLFNQIFPKDGSMIGTIQAFGAQVKNSAEVKYVGIQFKDHKNERSKWYKMPQSEALHDWFMKEMKGFPANKKWKYRMKARMPTARNSDSKRKKKTKTKKEVTAWMELAINIERVEETPPPTPGPSPRPSPEPTSPPSPRPSPSPTSQPSPGPSLEPTSPPSPRPSPGPTSPPSPRPSPEPTPPPSSKPTSPPTPDPTPYPLDYVSQWTKHPTRYPTTESPTFRPTSPPSRHPTLPPTNRPTDNPTNRPTNTPTNKPTNRPTKRPTNNPTHLPTNDPTKPPTPRPTSPPTPEATEAVQQAPPQRLHQHVRDDPWEYGGKIQYSSGRVLFFFDGNPFVCTGTVVDDGDHPDRTLILTAGHCAFKYDNQGGRFADYALFIPNQDETRGQGTDERCGNDPLGCWTLAFALVDYNWTTRNFPSSVPWDYAIYVVQNVPESHQPGFVYKEQPELSTILEDIVTKFPIDFTYNQKTAPATHTHALGYTFNKDPDFRYCAKDLTTKYGISSYQNLWLGVCDMSGGSSGGVWMKDTKDDGSGTIISVNSWGYSSSTGMAGPNFYTEGGAKVECLFEKAKVIDFDDVENGGVIVSDC